MHSTHIIILSILFNTALMQVQNENDDVIYTCDNDEFCESALPGSKCVKNKCKCTLEEGCRGEDLPVVVRKIGLPCKHDSDCLIDNSRCMEDRCICIDGTAASQDEKNCLSLSNKLNMACQENIQCSNIKLSECRKGFCKCRSGMKSYRGSCYLNKALGDFCQSDEECKSIEHSECFRSTCVCSKNFVKGETACLAAGKELGSTCLEDVQCTWIMGDGAQCSQNKCVCHEIYHYKEKSKKCVQHMKLLQNCTRNEDCVEEYEDEEYLECSSDICQCKWPYQEFEDDCLFAMASPLKAFILLILSSLMYLYLF